MKKKTTFLILMMLTIISMAIPVHSEAHITVTIDGAELLFPDARPFIEEGRTLVPISHIARALGSEVAWNPDTRIVGFQKGSDIILLQIGSRSVTINGNRHTIDVPAKISESRTYVPLRFVSEALGANVEWVAETRTVLITTDGSVAVTPPLEVPSGYEVVSGFTLPKERGGQTGFHFDARETEYGVFSASIALKGGDVEKNYNDMHQAIESKYGKSTADEAINYAKTGNTTQKHIQVPTGDLRVWTNEGGINVRFEHSK